MENFTEDDYWFPQIFPCPNPFICIVEVTLVIAVVFLSITGNVLNLGVLMSTRSLRNCHGHLLMSLSTADLITGLVLTLSIYPSATFRSSPDSWPYGDTVCLIATYLIEIGITNSGTTLTLLSIERYIAVAHPLRYARVVTKRVTLTCIGVTWIGSVALFSTIFAGFPKYFYVPMFYVCLPMVFSVTSVVQWILLISIVAPILIICITSCIVSKKLRPRSKTNEITSDSTTSRTKLKLKTFRMVQVMTTAFVVSYVPFPAATYITYAARISMPQVVAFGLFWLLLASSFFNVIIYFTMNTTFRKRIEQIIDPLLAVFLSKSDSLEHSDVASSSRMNTVDLNRLNNERIKASHGSMNTIESTI